MSLKIKRGQKEKIESALSEAMAQLEIEDSSADDLKKKELALKTDLRANSFGPARDQDSSLQLQSHLAGGQVTVTVTL
ncbi:hypothetical protein V494_05354 [Pseudogymnoascus sp. VKM F-4513 (FW-928)]|nr:hypothetical protein V494_05354 [Pseudogymnoascus sp. VKM F-4513 (FW-928)]